MWGMWHVREEEKKNVCRVVVGKPETNRPLGRCRRGRENNGSQTRRMGAQTRLSWLRTGINCGLF